MVCSHTQFLNRYTANSEQLRHASTALCAEGGAITTRRSRPRRPTRRTRRPAPRRRLQRRGCRGMLAPRPCTWCARPSDTLHRTRAHLPPPPRRTAGVPVSLRGQRHRRRRQGWRGADVREQREPCRAMPHMGLLHTPHSGAMSYEYTCHACAAAAAGSSASLGTVGRTGATAACACAAEDDPGGAGGTSSRAGHDGTGTGVAWYMRFSSKSTSHGYGGCAGYPRASRATVHAGVHGRGHVSQFAASEARVRDVPL